MVTLIFTVLNEEASIPLLMEDILASTFLPHEIVVVDGGSKDATFSVIQGYKDRLHTQGIDLNLIKRPGVNISEGRNIAIGEAKCPYIAVTDAGCRLDPNWLERLVEPLMKNRADFVGGFFRPLTVNRFQRVLAQLTTAPRPTSDFLPSSRSVAFKKTLWQKVGGYPEWLRWGEDTLFDRRCLESGARYEVTADAVVLWEVRNNFSAAMKQYFRYAFGDGLAGRLSGSHLALQGVYWGSLLTALALGPWGLTPIVLYPLVWMVRRQVTATAPLLPTYLVALGIQMARFGGFIWGLTRRLLKQERFS